MNIIEESHSPKVFENKVHLILSGQSPLDKAQSCRQLNPKLWSLIPNLGMALGGSTSVFANNSSLLSEEIITKFSNSINK